MRELVTIGDLHAARPAARSRARRRSMGFVEMGVTNPNFVAPSDAQMSASPPGSALVNAASALAAYMATSGTPSEHVNDPMVLAFQQAWNADPVSNLNGASSQLSDDGGYGPNTQAALSAFGAYAVPAVNSGASPVVTPPSPSPVAPVVPGTSPAAPSTAAKSDLLPILAIVGVAGLAAWLLFFRKKKRGSSRRSSSTSMVLVKSNPRRRSRGAFA
jgi:LPXTG-motif cell wall-anchored protein